MLKKLVVLAVVVWGAAVPAQASNLLRTEVYAIDSYGRPSLLPEAVCIDPGMAIRLQADGVDDRGYRFYLPAENFVWTLTRSSGFAERWRPDHLPPRGSFQRSQRFPEVIYTIAPYDLGAYGVLDTEAEGYWINRLQFVDPRMPGARCQYAIADAYVQVNNPAPPAPQPPYPPQPPFPPNPPQPPNPPNPGGHACRGFCSVGDRCTDGCPPRGSCNYVPAQWPYWRVLSCR